MDAAAARLRAILQREVVVHRELLRLARSRHILLRQGRFEEAADLAVLEAAYIVTLRDLESRRSTLARQVPDADRVTVRSTRQIAALVRGLGAVERANRALWSQRVLAPALAAVVAAARPAARAGLN